MEFFQRAKTVRLKSQHGKFLSADQDEEAIKQKTNGSTPDTRWIVEIVEGKPGLIRLKSSQSWKYLCASEGNTMFTGSKVTQASPRMKLQPSVEWEPVKEGMYLKLKTSQGKFLKANGQIWRYSVTHDSPSTTATQDWVYWCVEILEFVAHDSGGGDVEVEKKVVDDNNGGVSRSSSVGSNSAGSVPVSPRVGGVPMSPGGGGGVPSPGGSVKSQWAPPPSFTGVMDSLKRQNSDEEQTPSPPAPKPAEPATRQDQYRPTRFVPEPVQKPIHNIPTPTKPPVPEPAMKQDQSHHTRFSPSFQPIFDDEPLRRTPPQVAPPPSRTPPQYTNDTKNSGSSGSSNKLNSLLGDMQNIIDDNNNYGETQDFGGETVFFENQLPPEVQKAKKVLQGIMNEDFRSAYYSGHLKKAENAIAILLSYNYHLKPQTQVKLQRFQDQILFLKTNHDTAFTNLDDYEKFVTMRSEMKAHAQQDAAKARELQNAEQECLGVVAVARAKREDLLRQLAEVDAEIRAAEGRVKENAFRIDELCGVIEKKKEMYMEMESHEKKWSEKKAEAKKMIRHVERQWNEMKIGFQMLE